MRRTGKTKTFQESVVHPIMEVLSQRIEQFHTTADIDIALIRFALNEFSKNLEEVILDISEHYFNKVLPTFEGIRSRTDLGALIKDGIAVKPEPSESDFLDSFDDYIRGRGRNLVKSSNYLVALSKNQQITFCRAVWLLMQLDIIKKEIQENNMLPDSSFLRISISYFAHLLQLYHVAKIRALEANYEGDLPFPTPFDWTPEGVEPKTGKIPLSVTPTDAARCVAKILIDANKPNAPRAAIARELCSKYTFVGSDGENINSFAAILSEKINQQEFDGKLPSNYEEVIATIQECVLKAETRAHKRKID